MWDCMPQCGMVFPSVGKCSQCGKVCLVWEGVPQSRRVCPSVGRCYLGVGAIDKYSVSRK